MVSIVPLRIKTLSQFHQLRGLPRTEHPLISIFDVSTLKIERSNEPLSLVLDFYCIALKKNVNAKMKYGQQQYDFNDGMMSFVAPGQVFGIEMAQNEVLKHTGWIMLIHPDFLWKTPLANLIKKYEYFNYAVHEALHLSEKEELLLVGILQNINQEYQSNIDNFTQDIIIAQLEVFFNYCERFYHRQFITRKITNHQVLERLEGILNDYFNSDDLITKGLPTVQYIADLLNVSPNYLGKLLKLLTGQSTQHHIHNKLIERAKERLSTTPLSVSEIAYELGFEHPQSFSKLFKTKTQQSPLEFRQLFN